MKHNFPYVISKRSIKIIIFCILQKVLLEYVYRNIIFPPFYYFGFENNFDLSRCIISWALYVIVPLFNIAGSHNETLSKQAVAFLLNAIYMPCLILYEYMRNTPFVLLITLYYVVMILGVNCIYPISVRVRVGKYRNFENVAISIGYILGFVVLFVWSYYAHFRIQIDLFDVYTARLAARQFSTPRIIVYMRAMARGVIPLLVVYSLYKSKKIQATYFIVIQAVQFFIDGSKSVVFVLILGIFSYFFIEKCHHIIDKIPEIMTVGAIFAILEHIVLQTSYLANSIFRRAMFLPALLNYQYFDLAENNGFDYYRQSLGFLGESHYNQSIALVVGSQYYRNENVNANNGLFSDAYVNLGALGCIIMPILIVIVFKLIEGAGERLPKSVWTVCVIQVFFSFTGSSFFTVLLTHGCLLMILILYCLAPVGKDAQRLHIE